MPLPMQTAEPMKSDSPSLNDLRAEIDRLDDSMHKLLCERTAIVERIRSLKGGGDVMRPGREAAIIRRLLRQHEGPLPKPAIARMWRELIAVQTLMQGPLSVAVYAPGDNTGLWDLARDHYGSHVPMHAVGSAHGALRAVSEGTASVAVLPLPESEEANPWWTSLLSDEDGMPRIVGRLPFVSRGNARTTASGALVVAKVPLEATGEDATIVALHLATPFSRDRLGTVFRQAKIENVSYLGATASINADERVHLLELSGFLELDGPLLMGLERRLGEALYRLHVVGAYPIPMMLEDETS